MLEKEYSIFSFFWIYLEIIMILMLFLNYVIFRKDKFPWKKFSSFWGKPLVSRSKATLEIQSMSARSCYSKKYLNFFCEDSTNQWVSILNLLVHLSVDNSCTKYQRTRPSFYLKLLSVEQLIYISNCYFRFYHLNMLIINFDIDYCSFLL